MKSILKTLLFVFLCSCSPKPAVNDNMKNLHSSMDGIRQQLQELKQIVDELSSCYTYINHRKYVWERYDDWYATNVLDNVTIYVDIYNIHMYDSTEGNFITLSENDCSKKLYDSLVINDILNGDIY